MVNRLLRFLVSILVTAITVFVLAQYLPGLQVTDISGAIVFGVILGLLNAFVRPIVKLLSLPITILTMGLFSFVINALIFWLASGFTKAVEVDGFLYALLASLIVSIVNGMINRFMKK
jgi:putative membrane protein